MSTVETFSSHRNKKNNMSASAAATPKKIPRVKQTPLRLPLPNNSTPAKKKSTTVATAAVTIVDDDGRAERRQGTACLPHALVCRNEELALVLHSLPRQGAGRHGSCVEHYAGNYLRLFEKLFEINLCVLISNNLRIICPLEII